MRFLFVHTEPEIAILAFAWGIVWIRRARTLFRGQALLEERAYQIAGTIWSVGIVLVIIWAVMR
jgi:hypothetical protein